MLKKIELLMNLFLIFFSPCYPRITMGSLNKFRQFGSAVWPDKANIYILTEEPYYIDNGIEYLPKTLIF